MAFSNKYSYLLLRLGVVVLTLSAWRTEAVENIDTREPIFLNSPALGEEDFFGYSVVIHQVAVAPPGDFNAAISNSRIIVGAPKGTFPGGLSELILNTSQPENETGLVYQCRLNVSEGCSPVGRSNNPGVVDRRLFDDQRDNESMTSSVNVIGEQKTGQLLGQTLLSSGDVFVACAPRWLAVSPEPSEVIDKRQPRGRCFYSGRNLSSFLELRPCDGDDGQNAITTGTTTCQSGFGAHLFDVSGMTSLLVSGPGASNFRGEMFVYNDIGAKTADSVSPSPDANSGVLDGAYEANSLYDGWSVASGRITSQSTPSYVTSMPRYDGQSYLGKINIRQPLNLMNILNTSASGFDELSGDQMGEYFGYVVITADLNADSWDEIIVGAPMYSGSTMNRQPEQGRVYVFKNEGGIINPTAIILELQGENIASARFGHSVVSLGDVNDDGYGDIAIGAPYYNAQNNPNANGSVFIYYGEENYISQTPNQIISAESVMQSLPNVTSLKTFGFSLSSGVDVDGNEYQDLLVGAYASQAAVLFRTLSIAKINFNLTTNTDVVNLVESETSFVVTLCASFSGRGLSDRPLDVSFTINQDGPQRVIFDGPNAGSFKGVLNFPRTDEQRCSSVTVRAKPIEDLPPSVNLRDPIVIRVIFNQIDLELSTSSNLVDLRGSPVIRPAGEFTTLLTPSVNCSDVCRPDLTVQITDVSFRTSSSALPGRTAIIAGEVTAVRFTLNVNNIADDPAISSMLSFTLPSVDFLSVPTQDSLSCSNNNGRVYSCSLKRFISARESVSDIVIEWTVATERLIGSESAITATFSVGLPQLSSDVENDTTNNDVSRSINITAITSPVIDTLVFRIAPSMYSIDPPTLENTIIVAMDIGGSVELRATVGNRGPSTIPKALFKLYVPTIAAMLANGTNLYYLYVVQLRQEGATNLVCTQDLINPDGFSFSDISRRRRSISRERREAGSIESVTAAVDCTDTTHPSCQLFQCEVSNFNREFTVEVVALLDRRFYMSQTGGFTFQAYATIDSLDGFNQYDTDLSDNAKTSRKYNLCPPTPEVVDIYLRIWLPVICGLLALIFLICAFIALIRCGFFRRKKLEEAKKEAEGGNFQVRQIPPEEPAVMFGEDVDVKEGLDGEIEPANSGDIGDTADIKDGKVAVADNDPEETSL